MNEKKIPTILSLIILILAAAGGAFFISRPQIFTSRADITCEPINIKITNITDKSFTVSWSTQKNCLTSLNFTQPSTKTIKDLRSENQKNLARSTHYYLADNLSPETNYQFEIISGDQTYHESSYSAQTAPVPQTSIPVANLAWGKVLDENHDPLSDLIIYLDIPGAAQLSSLTSTQGVWIVSLANSFDATHSDWFFPPGNTVEYITIDGGTIGQISLTGNTDFNDPVPDIVFSLSNPPTLSFEEQEGLSESGNFPSPENSLPNLNIEFQLQNPKEGETLKTLTPEFFGTAPKDSILEITLESPQTFTAEIEPNSSGEWSWSPPADLTPGEHTLTVKVTNSITGLSETISRKFFVYAAESDNPAFESSPSASLNTPTPTPITSPTPTPTSPVISPTSVPTLSLTPTPTTVIRSAKPATDSGIPSPGTTLPTLLALFFGLILFSTGAVFVLK